VKDNLCASRATCTGEPLESGCVVYAVRSDWLRGSTGVMLTATDMEFTTPAFSGSDGLVTAVAQDATSGQVLMVAHMNREAWDETLASGRAVYFSRARQRLWRKGEESGNVQHVREIYVDCDADTVLLKVDQVGGAACHEGYPTCFFRQITPDGVKIVAKKVFEPKDVYGKGE
jgi:phosphoribosyl-AMP cyclohydrolase